MDTDRAIPLETLASRPDVLAAECLLRASFSNVKVARSEFYPTLSISGSAGWTNNGVTINPYQILLNAISSLTQPLFAQGRLKANLKVAQSRQEQAQITFEKALLVAGVRCVTHWPTVGLAAPARRHAPSRWKPPNEPTRTVD